ncbi:MAG: hypothetical protein AB7T49_13065 [Oligoflexales bacterium]
MRPKGPFEIATRSALLEIIESHTSESKFGYVLTKENLESLVSSLYELLATSRSLKDAGDRFIATNFADSLPSSPSTKARRGSPS